MHQVLELLYYNNFPVLEKVLFHCKCFRFASV